MKHIASRDNPTFKQLRLLAGDAHEQRNRQRTIIDGPHLVSAYRHRIGMPETLVVSESGLLNPEIQGLVNLYNRLDTLVMRDTLFRELSGTTTPTGILAVIDIPDAPTGSIKGDCILLDGVQDSGNVGSILRTAAAAGLHDIALGPGCAGAWTPRVLRAAQGAHFGLRIREHADLASIMRDFPGSTVATVALGGDSLYSLDLRGEVAWLFGSEGRGVSADLLSLATVGATVPLAAGTESLNVAAAAAVCLFESVRQRAVPK